MQRLEVSGAVLPLYGSLDVKGLVINVCINLYLFDVVILVHGREQDQVQ
jgi:hypothetical protein